MKDTLKNAAMTILTVLLCLSVATASYFFFINSQIRSRETEARVSSQNRIAQLSEVVKEGERTWSRLAQEKDIELDSLREDNEDLLTAIRRSDERITTLTEVNAQLRTVRVVVRRDNVTQTEEPTEPGEPVRTRVEFDEVWNDFMRVSGFTLTNPAEAEIQVDYTRPIRITVATTQRPDLSWNVHVSTDAPNLEVGEIESIISPFSRPHEETPWYNGVYIGLGAAVGRGQGIAGYGQLELGYDFGNVEVGLLVTGLAYDTGGAIGGGLAVRFNPFAL